MRVAYLKKKAKGREVLYKVYGGYFFLTVKNYLNTKKILSPVVTSAHPLLTEQHLERHPTKHPIHPVLRQKLTVGQRMADIIATFGGSWTFIGLFVAVIIVWITLNAVILLENPFDPFPFILLNLTLSMLAALQAPVILMAQNRQAERDRIDAKYDHAVNRKAEREIEVVQQELDAIKRKIFH